VTWLLERTVDKRFSPGGPTHGQRHQYLYPHSSCARWETAPAGRKAGCAVNDDDESGSPFFLSYAHVTEGSSGAGEAPDPDGLVSRFFDDLTENVSQLICPRADVPVGFMDQGMRGGMEWPDELLHAVGTCQVLVALLSARYLQSQWCRMEWHAFSLRSVRREAGTGASPRQGCIVPVIWAPFYSALPEHIHRIEIFSPTRVAEQGVRGHYQGNGVVGLLRMNRLHESYEIVAWQLAMHIAHIYHSQRTEHRQFNETELREVLQEDSRGG